MEHNSSVYVRSVRCHSNNPALQETSWRGLTTMGQQVQRSKPCFLLSLQSQLESLLIVMSHEQSNSRAPRSSSHRSSDFQERLQNDLPCPISVVLDNQERISWKQGCLLPRRLIFQSHHPNDLPIRTSQRWFESMHLFVSDGYSR
jgi:hypothetical protein